jgi:Methyltransferase domain
VSSGEVKRFECAASILRLVPIPGLTRRRSSSHTDASRVSAEAAEAILDRLLEPEELIDRFDATYLDDLPAILCEVHGVSDQNLSGHPIEKELRELWKLTGRPPEELSIAELRGALSADLGIDPRGYSPREAPRSVRRKHGYDRVRSWRKASGTRLGAESDAPRMEAAAVRALQAEYSLQSGGQQEVEFADLGRPETGDPWTSLILELRDRGVISSGEPCLTIGPRWVGEIDYFRERLGLEEMIGLDLFSPDNSRITVGDMHAMPFHEDTFGLVYQRNTFDKSYDIRTALRECVRCLRAGGVLISDDCYAYTAGVSELSRTNIKHNVQILRVLGQHVLQILYDRETPSAETWIERVGQLAVTVRK